MCESKIYPVANVSFFSTTAVCNQSIASRVHPGPLNVYIFQICGTYTSSWTSNCACPSPVRMFQKSGTMWLLLFCDLCHSSLRMLISLLCLVIKVFWGSWTWYTSGPSPENKFCCESPLPRTQWWQKIWAKKKQIFLWVFLNFFLICCIIIWSDLHMTLWACNPRCRHCRWDLTDKVEKRQTDRRREQYVNLLTLDVSCPDFAVLLVPQLTLTVVSLCTWSACQPHSLTVADHDGMVQFEVPRSPWSWRLTTTVHWRSVHNGVFNDRRGRLWQSTSADLATNKTTLPCIEPKTNEHYKSWSAFNPQGSKNRPPSGHLRLKNAVWRVKHSF